MRLIDADTLRDKCDEYDWDTIDNEPTIDAIPIDFIMREIERNEYIWERSHPKVATYYKDAVKALENLLKEWERYDEDVKNGNQDD